MQVTDHGKSLSPGQKTDAAIKESIDRAFWKDDVLRAIESFQIDVHVKNGIVYLNGHIVGTTSQSRIKNAIRTIPGLLGIQNNLISDDKLTLEIAASLGTMEHTYGCKFFTGASHGVISLNGIVHDENVKLLAEKCAASNPNVRAVINNVRVSGAETALPDQPFLQPTIGEIIYFLDGISGIVKQVIINPNNRRVVAMTLWGQFDQRQDLKSSKHAEARPPERLVIVPMDVVRYMTKVSGFLLINSNENTRYMDFDPTRFSPPQNDWKAPYPYCPDDVLFPVEKHSEKYQNLEQGPLPPLTTAALKEQLLWEQLLADESLGG
ncbi:MAG TPA: BON domain-containing protein [Anaerolineales bacterium]|nr:BON domain-containing protein [Anaerolineales bacterium]